MLLFQKTKLLNIDFFFSINFIIFIYLNLSFYTMKIPSYISFFSRINIIQIIILKYNFIQNYKINSKTILNLLINYNKSFLDYFLYIYRDINYNKFLK